MNKAHNIEKAATHSLDSGKSAQSKMPKMAKILAYLSKKRISIALLYLIIMLLLLVISALLYFLIINVSSMFTANAMAEPMAIDIYVLSIIIGFMLVVLLLVVRRFEIDCNQTLQHYKHK